LAEGGFTVIAMSRFGYLRTPLPADASPAAQADAPRVLLDALKMPEAAILGGSAGAPSAIEFCLAARRACSAMVLLVPAFFPPGALPVRAQPSFMFESVLRIDFFFWLNMKVAGTPCWKKSSPSRCAISKTPRGRGAGTHFADCAGHLPLSRFAAKLWNDLAIVASSRVRAERIASPALVIGIEDDLFGSTRAAAWRRNAFRGTRFVSFPTEAPVGDARASSRWR